MSDIAVIGGGASGITASIFASRMGASVTIFEKNSRIGKKLLLTGNSRCNLTNINTCFERYHGDDPDFCKPALESFDHNAAIDFFEDIGLLTKVEEGGKVFPYCDRASAVLDILRIECEKLGVDIKCDFDVKEIIKRKNCFEIISWGGQHEFAQKVIFSVGGMASPDLGGGSAGYDILKKLGHKSTPLRPSIVQLKTDTDAIKGLKGIKCQAKATLGDISYTGELLFCDYGVSGPPIFSLSSYYSGGESTLYLDLFPDIDEKKLFMLLKNKVDNNFEVDNLFIGLAHKNLGSAILKQAGIFTGESLTSEKLSKIAKTSKKFRLLVYSTQSWNNAQVTKGGIVTKEIDKYTMESLKCPGLYITGEILDIDGDCGGYNLQWAWSSGYLAGTNAAAKLFE